MLACRPRYNLKSLGVTQIDRSSKVPSAASPRVQLTKSYSAMQMNKNHKLLLFWLVLLMTAIRVYYYAQARV